jgi:methylenetetrahydrofolate reductase (NADPH)
VYLLTARAARMFHEGRIPGIVVTRPLLEECERWAASTDRGRAYFQELAAKQVAVFRGLGYRGAYLGGIHDLAAVERILEIERGYAPDDWRTFAQEIAWSREGEFFLYPADGEEGTGPWPARPARADVMYAVSKRVHRAMFTPGHLLSRWGAALCRGARDPGQGPAPLRGIERLSKTILYRCRDCGDCSLPDVAFLCPESQCAKNQRNGPCGGTREGRCEVEGIGECIWLRAYERLKHDGAEQSLLAHAPVVQNQGLRGTSSWANNWLGLDHAARPITRPGVPRGS